MEVLAAVAASVPAALSLAEKALKHLEGGENSEARESIGTLKNMLSTFQNYLSFFMEEEQQGRNLVNDIRDLTFDIEQAIDEFMFDVPFHDHTSRFMKCFYDKAYSYNNGTAVRKLSTRRERIEEKARKIGDLYNNLTVGVPIPTSVTRTEDFSTHQNVGGEKMVGFEKQRKDLVQQLINGDSKRATIQVVGPGGSGKTFLVNDVYQDSKIKKRFDRKAWIHMPQHFKVTDRGLLLDYLQKQLGLGPGKTLQKYLEGKRYLIVLDNVWSKQDYAYIANFLPRNFTGSRVIITTRNSNVDDKPDHTHKLDGLNEEEAYTLFCIKAFPDGTCPEDLMKLSKDIIERCDRLPLAISTVGTLLSKKRRPIKSEWMKFCQNIGSEIENHDSFQFNSFLKASFVDLPSNLRSCFFYFSMFPAGHSIERGRLLRSWIGEGFLEEVSGKTMEEVAETSLNDLIARSLVRVSTLEIDGRVRSCNVLRIHHEFIVHLYGNKENFIKVINEQNPRASVGNARRLSVHHNNIAAKLLEISDPGLVRTLFAFEHKDVSPENSSIIPGTTANQMKKMLHLFKLLKVLDLQGMPLNYFPKDISSFVLLRCLNLRQTNIKKVPRSIKKLSFLEILDLKYTLVTKLPKFIYKLQKLSHLLVSFRGSQDNLSSAEAQGVTVYAGIRALSKSLQKVSLINVKNQTRFIQELGKLTQLRKLGLADIKKESGVEVLTSIQKMINLMTLDLRAREGEYLDLNVDMGNPHEHIQHLYLKGRLNSLPKWISSTSLPSLVKVVLKGSKLNEDQSIALEALGALRNLMELEMIEFYTGKRLVFKAQMFKRLKKLHVEKFEQLLEVSLEKEALATLEKLTIRRCMQLKPLPRSYRAGHIKEFRALEMSEDFISDIRRRIAKGEMQPDCFQTTSNHSSSTTRRKRVLERLARLWLF